MKLILISLIGVIAALIIGNILYLRYIENPRERKRKEKQNENSGEAYPK